MDELLQMVLAHLKLQQGQDRIVRIGAIMADGDLPAIIERGPDGADSVKLLEQVLDRPLRARGTTTLTLVDDFAVAFSRVPVGQTEDEVVYVNQDDGRMTAILNDNTWRDHRIVYSPTFTESWRAWVAASGKMMGQLEMAEWIEERVQDFVNPAGAAMLELAQQFSVTRSGEFTSGVRVDGGSTSLKIVDNQAGNSSIQIPNTVDLAMRVFEGGDAYSFKAYFRWRIREQKLSLGFKLVNREDVLRQAVRDNIARARAALQGGAKEDTPFFCAVTPDPVRPL